MLAFAFRMMAALAVSAAAGEFIWSLLDSRVGLGAFCGYLIATLIVVGCFQYCALDG